MLQLNELRLVFAGNIINLRTGAGMTQAELGAKLNYSDKTVSKWERGEAIPDAFVLTELAELFGVTVDWLLSSHDAWEQPVEETPVEDIPRYSRSNIILLVVVAIWTVALTVFTSLWSAGIIWWKVFPIALPISLLTIVILQGVWKLTRGLPYFISAFVFSVFLLIFCLVPDFRSWPMFLVCIPAVALVFLACNLRIKPKKWEKVKDIARKVKDFELKDETLQ